MTRSPMSCLLSMSVLFTAFFLAGTQGSEVKAQNGTKEELLDTRGRPFAYKHIRIPKDIRPTHYNLFLHPDLKSLSFSGKVDISLECFKDTQKILFHSRKLKMKNIKVFDDKEAEIEVKDVSENTNWDLVILKLGKELKKGEKYHLHIDFDAKLATDMQGFYKSEYRTKNGEQRVLATTHFEPVYARKAFPCFDEPEFKATFEIKIKRAKEHRSISNMPIKKTSETKDGLFLDQYEPTVKMSTYLVAFVVSDFEYTETKTKNGVKVRVWARKDAVEDTRFSLDVAQDVLTYYEKFFNIKYPMPKIDLIALPDFDAGAMENWGLVTFRETLLLFNPKSGSASDKQYVAIVVAHELAHQWFGNLVTMKWWNDIWLNEGFANYMEYIGTDNYAKKWRVLEQFATQSFQTALDVDSVINTHPISVPVHNPAEMNEIFDAISYDKGASVIRMLRHFLGDKNFQKGLEKYLNKHAYGNAEADDLWQSLSEVSGSLNVRAVMNSWIKQKGFPVVTMRSKQTKRGDIADHIVVSQERFLIDPSLDKETRKSEIGQMRWFIPLTFITQYSDKEQLMWINQTSRTSFPINRSGWIKANVGHMGLYRVNYDEENWERLNNQLILDHKKFSAVDRSGLLNDAFNLARAGLLPMTIPLKLTQYLNKETEYFPWSSALGSLSYIGKMMSMTEAYGLYEKYLVRKFKPLELSLKWDNKGPMLEKYLRAIVLNSLCDHNEQGCIDVTQGLFTKFVDNDQNLSISPHLRSLVYSTVAKQGGTAEWEFLWDKYQEENDATHKTKLMAGLTASRQPWLLSRLLNYALDGNNIRLQDMVGVVIGVSRNHVGRLLAWEFYRANIEKIVKLVGKDTNDPGRLLEGLTGAFNTKLQLEEVQDFIRKHPSILGKLRASKKAVENIKVNIHWMKTHYNTVHQWLRETDNAEY